MKKKILKPYRLLTQELKQNLEDLSEPEFRYQAEVHFAQKKVLVSSGTQTTLHWPLDQNEPTIVSKDMSKLTESMLVLVADQATKMQICSSEIIDYDALRQMPSQSDNFYKIQAIAAQLLKLEGEHAD